MPFLAETPDPKQLCTGKFRLRHRIRKKAEGIFVGFVSFFDMVMWHKRFFEQFIPKQHRRKRAVFILRVVHIIVLRSKAHIETSFFELLTLSVRLKTHDFLPDVKMHKIYRINFTLM